MAEDSKDFPMECVKHVARCSCNCQFSGVDVEQNSHLQSCMVGKAQKYLGMRVTKKKMCIGYSRP